MSKLKQNQKRSFVKFYQSFGIPSRNTTHEHLGKTSLIFIQNSKEVTDETKIDDTVETMIRNLNRRKLGNY